MQVQKLVYIAHGFHLGLTDKPLIRNNIHAWQFGPVIPKLYKALQRFGNGEVSERLQADDKIDEGSFAYKLIRKVWESYGTMTGLELSALTHRRDTPWYNTNSNK